MYEPGTPSCHRVDGRARIARCFIRRAARHYNPRWAALAAMWMWKRGGQSHWATY
jgi:hypothetical protein